MTALDNELIDIRMLSNAPDQTKHIARFLIITFTLSWIAMGGVVWVGGMKKAGALLLVIMWIPGLVSLAYRKIAKLGFNDIGWKVGPLKYSALAFFVPLAVAAISYAIYWKTGISDFVPVSPEILAKKNVDSGAMLIAKFYPLLFLMGCFAALGEEIGWRGFLIPKLYNTRIRHPLLVSSLIWGVWHFPLILWGGYASSSLPLVSILLFTIVIIAAGVFVGWVRMMSGSVWTAMIYHGAHNLFLQTAFEVFNKPGPHSEFLGGESGVIPCTVYFILLGIGYLILRRSPDFLQKPALAI